MPDGKNREDVERGWNAFVDGCVHQETHTMSWKRGFVSAELLNATSYLKPYQYDWLLQREEDARLIKEQGEEIRDLRKEVREKDARNVRNLAYVILAMVVIGIVAALY